MMSERSWLRVTFGVFEQIDELTAAVAALFAAGVASDDVSLLTTRTRAAAIAKCRRGGAALPDRVTRDWVEIGALTNGGQAVISPGALAQALWSAEGNERSPSLTAALARHLPPHHAAALAEQIDRGGMLLCVEVVDGEREQVACEQLLRHSRFSVATHDFTTSC